jgi:acyl-CoA hydrolase
MTSFDWQKAYQDRIGTASSAIKLIRPGNSVFIGTGCAAPQYLIQALVNHSDHLADCDVIQLLTMGDAPYAQAKYRDKFRTQTFFISDNVRDAVNAGIAEYTPIFLSEVPAEFEDGRLPIDVALIMVSPPDHNGLCSFGVSVDIVKSASTNAKYVIAQVNKHMPRTLGDAYIHVNNIDMLVPHDEEIIQVDPPKLGEEIRKIGQNVAHLVDDGSTIEFGIGSIPQAVAEFLHEKKDLGVHTEMFSDWVIELVECGAVSCKKKTINRHRITASFCMGSQKLYDYIDNNPLFEFQPTEYVNDPHVIDQHEKMVAINMGLEVDLTGQVCADSIGSKFYSGFGGQVDFIRGAARSRGGKAIIALPATAKDGEVSRIVCSLSEGAGVVTTRADVHYVVTEYGVAYLHGKSIRERTLALISIAHPKFRKELIHQAKQRQLIPQDLLELAFEETRYPEMLERYESLRDGTEIFFRPVKPTDEEALSEMLYSLSSDSLHSRFFTHTMTFPRRNVQQLTNIDYDQNLAIVGVVPGPAGDEQIVAITQYFLDPKTNAAEVAFIVQDEWQLKGMGTFLLKYISQTAAKRGVKRFYAKVLPENKPMLAVFHNSGYPVKTEFDGEAYSIEYDLQKPLAHGGEG